jgi:hypothetical protein
MNEFPVLSTKSVVAKLGAVIYYIVSGAFFFVLMPISQFVSSVWSIAITHTSNDSPTGVLLLDGKYKTRQIGIISHCLQTHQRMDQLFMLLFCHLQLLLLSPILFFANQLLLKLLLCPLALAVRR